MQYGFFEIIEEGPNIRVIKVPGYLSKVIYGKIFQVVPLNNDTYLVSHSGQNTILKRSEAGVRINSFSYSFDTEYEDFDITKLGVYNVINYIYGSFIHKARVEIESVTYKIDEELLEKGLIILRYGMDYVLYDFINDCIISREFDNISIVDGKLIAEKCLYIATVNYNNTVAEEVTYPCDIFVGELNYDGSINKMQSQKWGTMISINDGSVNRAIREFAEETRIFNDSDKVLPFDYEEYLKNKENRGRN